LKAIGFSHQSSRYGWSNCLIDDRNIRKKGFSSIFYKRKLKYDLGESYEILQQLLINKLELDT
jgi:hypothetical protein